MNNDHRWDCYHHQDNLIIVIIVKLILHAKCISPFSHYSTSFLKLLTNIFMRGVVVQGSQDMT